MSWFRSLHFRFSLRTFLIVCILPVPLFTWLANIKISAVRQRSAIARLESRGVMITEEAPTPNWVTNLIRRFVDKDAFEMVTQVRRHDTPSKAGAVSSFDREELVALTQLKGLRDVDFIRRRILRSGDSSSQRRLSDSDLALLAEIRTLGSLITDAEMGEPTLLSLAQLPELHTLQLPNAPFSDHVLKRFRECKKLATLEFDATNVSSKGLRNLAVLPVLQTLSLRKLHGRDSPLAAIAECKALTRLIISDSHLKLEDAIAINRLPIQTLTLDDCRIDDGFVKLLHESATLQSLHMGGRDARHTYLNLRLDPVDP